MKEIKKVFGPYTVSKDKRNRVIVVYKDGSKTTKLYSRYLMEKHLGKSLSRKETVHHIDGNPFNDDLKNLEVIDLKNHAKQDSRKVKPVKIICVRCKKEAYKNAKDLHNNSKHKKAGPFCSKSCAGKYGTDIQNGRIKPLPAQPGFPIEKREYYK